MIQVVIVPTRPDQKENADIQNEFTMNIRTAFGRCLETITLEVRTSIIVFM
jgi:hypothetical protein